MGEEGSQEEGEKEGEKKGGKGLLGWAPKEEEIIF